MDAAPGLTVIEPEVADVSPLDETVMVCAVAVLSVMLKVRVPALKAVAAGKTACASVEVQVTVGVAVFTRTPIEVWA